MVCQTWRRIQHSPVDSSYPLVGHVSPRSQSTEPPVYPTRERAPGPPCRGPSSGAAAGRVASRASISQPGGIGSPARRDTRKYGPVAKPPARCSGEVRRPTSRLSSGRTVEPGVEATERPGRADVGPRRGGAPPPAHGGTPRPSRTSTSSSSTRSPRSATTPWPVAPAPNCGFWDSLGRRDSERMESLPGHGNRGPASLQRQHAGAKLRHVPPETPRQVSRQRLAARTPTPPAPTTSPCSGARFAAGSSDGRRSPRPPRPRSARRPRHPVAAEEGANPGNQNPNVLPTWMRSGVTVKLMCGFAGASDHTVASKTPVTTNAAPV